MNFGSRLQQVHLLEKEHSHISIEGMLHHANCHWIFRSRSPTGARRRRQGIITLITEESDVRVNDQRLINDSSIRPYTEKVNQARIAL